MKRKKERKRGGGLCKTPQLLHLLISGCGSSGGGGGSWNVAVLGLGRLGGNSSSPAQAREAIKKDIGTWNDVLTLKPHERVILIPVTSLLPINPDRGEPRKWLAGKTNGYCRYAIRESLKVLGDNWANEGVREWGKEGGREGKNEWVRKGRKEEGGREDKNEWVRKGRREEGVREGRNEWVRKGRREEGGRRVEMSEWGRERGRKVRGRVKMSKEG